MADQPLVPHPGDGLELNLAGAVRSDPVELPEIDALEAQAPQAHQHALAQIVGIAHGPPDIGAVACQAALRGDDEAVIGVKRLTDQILADEGAVAVGGVDQVDAEAGNGLQRGQRLRAIRGIAPDAGTRNAHRAETEPVNREVSAEGEGAGCLDARHACLLPGQNPGQGPTRERAGGSGGGRAGTLGPGAGPGASGQAGSHSPLSVRQTLAGGSSAEPPPIEAEVSSTRQRRPVSAVCAACGRTVIWRGRPSLPW